MGFIVMILSAIIGIFLIVLGISRLRNRKNKLCSGIIALMGVALVVFAIWLELPK